MKIAILTQPLHNNYGGLLQAYALQHYLKNQGHDVLTIDFPWNRKLRYFGIKTIIGNIIRKYVLLRPIKSIFPLTDEQMRSIGQHTNRFTAQHIRTTQKIYSVAEFSYIKQYGFDAYVVGSDQVWRPAYSPGMPAFFLSFLNKEDNAKRVAYAASFGVDNCGEFSAAQLAEYAPLLQRFDAIGVREDSAVKLCHQCFGTTAEHVIDPTLLLEKEAYCELIAQDNIPASNGNMMVYVLDKAPEKQQIINTVASERGLTPFTVMPEQNGVYPPVTQWLRGFMDAEYVVTDSFHGVAFSIIFNKPFIAIGNHGRGLARFTSVLKMFDLEQRLILSPAELTAELINQPINFDKLNQLKAEKQQFAAVFLDKALAVMR
ncbi:polysaccharide pyruvyl transferase family protein [Klebsiella quasipneumoniae subsp. similipneumoniae]|uniref:polysaccharide pyruvyl transferase family protein n=1 Tax=Enterobacteriaceae TaxID=543 RepID=UPI0010F1E615|nr:MULTISPECIES: polysaccharide pyruvyl transferase family protein [Enterobacteriaceae]MBS2827226.1 polysaccharide pyruvyl transferase family protein [Klebsiella pneumoniae]QSF96641.1 polysaccharide pyruvyl transferase family protein [Escherichia coli]UDC49907.1 polysaccharide pyruvyl transferase family protein [Klebsiella quasipneumoniae subsp. similipneumoniae]UDC49912.1 polysaccharide pyruvyl transferase family protein [Klebsiella quasipneumoniae subsp. similipneumoniae]VGP27889.1 hypotheti